MDSAAAEPWTARPSSGVGIPSSGAPNASWDSAPTAQDSYREPSYQSSLPLQRSSGSRVSRWSDAPPGQADVTPASEDGPSPAAGLEPPYKKVRNDSQGVPGGADYRDDPGVPYGGDSGQGEAPPGLAYGRSGSGSTGPPSYGGAGAPSYGYGAQQMPTYGANQNYGSQHMPQQSAPVSFAPGSARGTGALFYKTKLCTKFKSGACTFNERCHFAHGVEELRKPPPGWEDMVSSAAGTTGKPSGGSVMGGTGRSFDGGAQRRTKICRYYVDGNCPYGDRCNFLHPEDAQKTPSMEPPGAGNVGAGRGGIRAPAVSRQNYKTRLCAKWEKGEPCDFGDKCHFAHGPAELQSFTGVASYPNGGPVVADFHYPGVGPELGAPKMYGDPNMMNPPPLTVPYGQPVDNANMGGAVPVGNANLNPNPYPSAGTTVVPYAGTQHDVNGVSANYNYWEEEKKWEGAGMAPPSQQTTAPTQGYVQTNQTPWMTNYMGDSGYPRRENDTAISQYPQEPPQQQQSTAYYSGGPVHEYQDQKQSVNPGYVQDDSQNKYQGEVRNGDGSYYHGAYNVPNYSNQQADYSTLYNVAEAWGGKM